MHGERDTGTAIQVLILSDVFKLQIWFIYKGFPLKYTRYAPVLHLCRSVRPEMWPKTFLSKSVYIYIHPNRFMERNLLKYINVSGD